jgi:bifunctional N-acetylglucosamine-1-phosphate-uridyltransferase/glucosamine-1-phosphate-acetyltransferase GlmU-like protein
LEVPSGKEETVTPAPTLFAIILAADHGELMRSKKPVVLHECAGLPLIAHAARLAL